MSDYQFNRLKWLICTVGIVSANNVFTSTAMLAMSVYYNYKGNKSKGVPNEKTV